MCGCEPSACRSGLSVCGCVMRLLYVCACVGCVFVSVCVRKSVLVVALKGCNYMDVCKYVHVSSCVYRSESQETYD